MDRQNANQLKPLQRKAKDESNVYGLLDFKRNEVTDTQEFQQITFFELNDDGTYQNGTTLEELILVAIERLTDLNSQIPCRENSIAITKLDEAFMWLEKRTHDRIKRDVEGTKLK